MLWTTGIRLWRWLWGKPVIELRPLADGRCVVSYDDETILVDDYARAVELACRLALE